MSIMDISFTNLCNTHLAHDRWRHS